MAPTDVVSFSAAGSAERAASFWIGHVARHFHLRAAAPAQIDIARLPAEHRNRGVPRNRGTQYIDGGGGAHDGAAQRHPVRTAFELGGAWRIFPLGGLGLRSHARHGTDHRGDRNYSSDCHVCPLGWPASDEIEIDVKMGPLSSLGSAAPVSTPSPTSPRSGPTFPSKIVTASWRQTNWLGITFACVRLITAFHNLTNHAAPSYLMRACSALFSFTSSMASLAVIGALLTSRASRAARASSGVRSFVQSLSADLSS